MAVVVGTNSYATEAELAAYALARGITIAGVQTTLLIKAMDWLEVQPFFYDKTEDTQALEHPRNEETTVPARIKQAQIVAALLIDGGASLLGAVDRAVKSEKVGSLAVEYMDGASESARYPELTALLRGFVGGSGGFTVSRG